MKQIATKLGLSAEASEDAICGELVKLLNRATTAEGEVAALKPKIELLNNRVTELLGEQIDADLATHGITDADKIAKIKPVLIRMENRAERIDFLALMGDGKKADAKDVKQPLTNRSGAKPPGGKVGTQSEDETKALETKKAQIIANRAAQIQRDQRGVTQMGAFLQAQKAVEAEITSGVISLK